MRKINIFQMEPEFILGDAQNLQALKKKLNEDSILLSQIEIDYNNDRNKYTQEFVSAKINHLKNQHLYCWLILKHYFDQAIYSETKTFPDFQKEEMRKKGWMLPLYFINKSIMATGGSPVTTEELFIRNFDKLFDILFDFNIGEKNSRIDRYYHQAIFNYKNHCYYSCAVSLFPIIESYHQYINHFNEDSFYKIKDNLDGIAEKIENVKQIYTIQIDYYINLVKQFNELAKKHYFKKSLGRKNEPTIINRNRIMHGLFSREISQKDCLQLFCVISNMKVIKNIIDANERMNEIEKELAKLQESIAKPKD